MKIIFCQFWILSVVFFCSPEIIAQNDRVEVFNRETENGVLIFVRNENPYPVTVELDLEIENLSANKPLPLTNVISSYRTEELLKLEVEDQGKSWNFRTKYRYYMGDVYARHRDGFAYRLPFEKGKRFKVAQGFGGSFSHQGDLQHAVDINMPEGSPVFAARGGVVVKLEEGNTKGGPSEEMMEYANFITIMHDDGTFANYSHLMHQGVAVQIGQEVRSDQLIGYSGNTGFSTGPHLHFVVKKTKRGGGFISIPVKFTTQNGIQLLEEGKSYTGY